MVEVDVWDVELGVVDVVVATLDWVVVRAALVWAAALWLVGACEVGSDDGVFRAAAGPLFSPRLGLVGAAKASESSWRFSWVTTTPEVGCSPSAAGTWSEPDVPVAESESDSSSAGSGAAGSSCSPPGSCAAAPPGASDEGVSSVWDTDRVRAS